MHGTFMLFFEDKNDLRNTKSNKCAVSTTV